MPTAIMAEMMSGQKMNGETNLRGIRKTAATQRMSMTIARSNTGAIIQCVEFLTGGGVSAFGASCIAPSFQSMGLP